MTQASIRLQANNQPNKYVTSFISGGIAGIFSKSLVAPFERVKILFQTSTKKFTYRAAFHEGLHICKTEGFWALWKGNGATAIRVFPYSAAQFVAFDYFQAAMMRSEATSIQRNIINFICGSLAGVCATALTYPAELIRTRMAIEKKSPYWTIYDQNNEIHLSKRRSWSLLSRNVPFIDRNYTLPWNWISYLSLFEK